MKKTLLLLTLGLAGLFSAQAAVGDVVTSLADISSGKAYTLQLNQAGDGRDGYYLPNSDGVGQMHGTNDANTAGKFLIIKVDEFSFTNSSNYVIYSVDNQKFLTNRSTDTNVYDESPKQALFHIEASNQENKFLIKSAQTGNWLQLGGSKQFLLADGWNKQDAGNRWTIAVADEDADVTAATGLLNEFVGSYVSSIESITDNETYIIKNVDRAFLNTTATVANASQAYYSEVAILKGTKGYYLYDVANNKFIGTENLTSTEQPVYHYSLEKHVADSSDKYNFKLTSSSNGCWLQTDGAPTLTITSTYNSPDNGNKWAFFPVGEFNSTEAKAKIDAMEADLEVSDPIADLGSLSTTEKYLLKNRHYDGYLKGNANGQRVQYVAAANANLKDPAFHWAIVNVADEGYVFRNLGTGAYLTNYTTRASAGEWEMTDNPVFVYNTLSEFADEAGVKYFAIRNRDRAADQSYLHVDGSGNTVNWGAINPSQFSISSCGTVDDYATTVEQALLTAATNKITALTSVAPDPESANGRIGYLTAEGNANVAAAYEAANTVNTTESASIHEKVEAIRSVVNAVYAGTTNVETGKFYTIRGAHETYEETYLNESYTNTAVLSGVTHNKLVATTLTGNYVPAYWRFNVVKGEGNDAKYNIIAANSGNVMRAVKWWTDCILLPSNHGEAGLYTYLDKTHRQNDGVTLRTTVDGTLSIDGGGNCTAENICSYNGNTPGNVWVIEPVESVPVSFNEQGYAAVQFPFAVKLPDGVSAYDLSTVSATNEAVTTAHTGNVVLANTPVILKGTTSANLTIVYNAEAAANEVAATLQGTLMPATVENAFVLSGNQLVPATEGNVPANSAYYVSTEGDTTPKTLAGAITTAIDELTIDANAATGAVYDLQGRRVSKATKGLYIINGKKVLVK